MMKKIIFISCFLLFCIYVICTTYAVIDSKYILEKLPDYKESQTKLDQFSNQWQQEIEKKQADLDKMYKDYDAEQVMLSDVLKKKREDELYNREKK
jgi:outer membrane protein